MANQRLNHRIILYVIYLQINFRKWQLREIRAIWYYLQMIGNKTPAHH